MAGMMDKPGLSHLKKVMRSKDRAFMEGGDEEGGEYSGEEYDMHIQGLKKALDIDEEKASAVYDIICSIVEEKLSMEGKDGEEEEGNDEGEKPKKKTFALIL